MNRDAGLHFDREAQVFHSSYLACIRRIPRPSDAQVEAFVDYVASAHSWYKHLPLLPPGIPFVFFLNPNAGRELVWTWRGGRYRDRTDMTPAHARFHYTWQPTRRYIERFGYLDYFVRAGTSFLLTTRRGVIDTRRFPRIQCRFGRWVGLPAGLRAAATVPVTGVIHPNGQQPFFWFVQWKEVKPSIARAVAGSAGVNDDVVATVISLLKSVPDDSAGRLTVRPELLKLPASTALKKKWLPAYAAQERQRVRETIRRMLAWIFDDDRNARGGTVQLR